MELTEPASLAMLIAIMGLSARSNRGDDVAALLVGDRIRIVLRHEEPVLASAVERIGCLVRITVVAVSEAVTPPAFTPTSRSAIRVAKSASVRSHSSMNASSAASFVS